MAKLDPREIGRLKEKLDELLAAKEQAATLAVVQAQADVDLVDAQNTAQIAASNVAMADGEVEVVEQSFLDLLAGDLQTV